MQSGTVQLTVKGMTCNNCARSVERKLAATPGVTKATVDLQAGQARVEYDAERVQPDSLYDRFVAFREGLGMEVLPASGGNTSFCSMYAVYEALPAPLKARIAGLRIKHDGTYNSGGYVRQGVTVTGDPRTSPGALHPLVCTHPDTGRRLLYLGRCRNAYLAGLDLEESEALLDELWSYVARPEFAWEHVWRAGDLVLWDNRCTMHRRDAFDPGARRIMHRTQIKGEARPA